MVKARIFLQILSADGTTQLGSIRHQWDQLMVGYNLCVYFPENARDVKEKALILSAAFLLVCIFFSHWIAVIDII